MQRSFAAALSLWCITQPATITVRHSAQYPSRLLLPVIPR